MTPLSMAPLPVAPLPVEIGGGPLLLAGQYQQAMVRAPDRADCAPETAVLLCNPFGQEAIRCHRTFRMLSERLARSGVPSLRFDYYATGESPGEDGDGDLSRWQRDVLLAHDVLASRSGAGSIVWIGLRVGAIVALSAAKSAPARPQRVILWDPVIDGRRYLQELRARHAFWTRRRDETYEALGFLLPERLRSQLAAIDLPAGLDDCPRETHVVIGAGVPGSRRIAGMSPRRAGLQCHVVGRTVEWCTNEALGSQWVPSEALDLLLALVVAAPCGAQPDFHGTCGPLVPAERPRPAAAAVIPPCPTAGIAVKEAGVRFGKAGHLAGTVTLPDCDVRFGFVIPSAGLLHRIGPHRMHVRLARHAATRGIATIRFDLPGIGDSLPAPGRGPYAAQELRAARDAIDLLEQETGATRFVCSGLCSGADTACMLAVNDPRVAGAFLMEPHCYPNLFSPMLRLMRRLRAYGPQQFAARIGQLVQLQDLRRPRHAADQDRMPLAPREFAALLEKLLERGVHLHLVYSGSTMGRLDLQRHRRQVFAGLAQSPLFSVELLAGSDHLFTPVAEMHRLERSFLALLDRVMQPAVSASVAAVPAAAPPPSASQPLGREVSPGAVALRPGSGR